MDVTEVIGSMGKSQVKALIALLLRPLPGCFTFLSLQISLIELDHWCSPPNLYSNMTSEDWKKCCIPKGSDGSLSRCEYYEPRPGQNETGDKMFCDSWDYGDSFYESTRAEWDLVCSRGMYVSMIYLLQTLGNLVIYVPSGLLADRFGRKPVCLVGITASAIINLLSGFCTTVEQMMVTRFLSGMAFGAYQNSFIVLYLECVGQSYRSWVILSFSGTWGIFSTVVSAMAYFFSDWRILFYLSSLPSHIPIFLIVWIWVPESARWLLSVKRYEEAEKVILQHTKENGIKIVDTQSVMEELKKKVEMDKEKQGRVSFLDLLKEKEIRKATIFIYATYVLTVFVNHGYHISIVRLGGSLHVNLMLSGVVDVFSVVLFFVLIKYTTKRRGLLLTSVLAGVSFLLTIPIGDDLRWLRIVFAMCGRFASSTAYNLLYVYATEVFPTSLRVAGVSGGMSSGRIGSILASFTDDMGRAYGRNAPITLFGVLSFLTAGMLLLLPEIRNRNLPDSLAETKIVASGGKNDGGNMEMNAVS